MAQEKIEILFKPKGNKALEFAIKNLDVATKRLQGTTSMYEKELKNMGLTQKQVNKFLRMQTKTLRINAGAFATLRSNLLLYSFAAGLAQRAIVAFVEKAAKVEDLSRGFRSLSSSMGSSKDVMDALKKATDGTVNSTDLMQQANNAMMLGIVKSKEEMAELFDTAQRLGQALGKDTVSSIESLVTGMGRQSRLMLDNLGIIVKSEDAYERYAQKIGVTKDSLTDMQKKEAFNQEVLRVSKKIVDDLGVEHLSTNAKIQVMNSAVHDLSVAVGEVLIPVLNIMASSLLALSKHFDAQKIKNYGVALVGVGSAYLIVSGTALKAAKASLLFIKTNKALLGVMLAVTAVAEFLDRKFDLFGLNTEELDKSIESLNGELDGFDDNLDSIGNKMKKVNEESAVNIAHIKMLNAEQGLSNTLKEKQEILDERKNKLDRLREDALISKQKAAELQKMQYDLDTEQFKLDQLIHQTKIDNAFELAETITNFANQRASQVREAADSELGIISEQQQKEMDLLKNRASYQRASARQQDIMEQEIVKKHEEREKKVRDKANKRLVMAFRADQALSIAKTIMNTSEAAMKAMGQTGIFGFPMASIIKAMGAMEVAMIASQSPPKMAQGGLIGGRRHSQGGTMIEAERGEFVVSRRGVDAIGLEALNRINAGGGGGTTNISFSGNVLSKDFLEDEAIPQIKEALRRGGDIGVG